MKSAVTLVLFGLLCSGCALTTASVDIPYQTGGVARPVPGAAANLVSVTTTDARTTYRDRVSTKKNGYGMEMAAIVPSNDLTATMSDAFRQELAARGYRIGQGGAQVQVELVRFYNDFKNGFFSGDAQANVAFNVKVSSAAAAVVFTKYYEGTGIEPNIMMAGGDNARAALMKAFTASVTSAVSDDDFLRAITVAGGKSGQPVAAMQQGSW